MKKGLKKLLSISLVAVLSLSVLAGCASDGGDTNDTGENNTENDGERVVNFGYVNWAEGVAMTHVVKAILEDELDYEVNATMADAGVVFTSLADGDTDFFIEGWLPVTHKDYIDRYGDDLEVLGANYEGARIGTVVPEYVEIDSLEELKGQEDKFEGQIVGIDAGAGVMQATEAAIEEYELDMELLTGSEPVMTASIQDAIDNEEWVAVTGWTPHWKFNEWDLKFLDDPKGVYGEAETLHTIAKKDVQEDENLADALEFIENFEMDDDQLSNLMHEFEEGSDEETTAREWIEENKELVDSWLPAK